METTQSEPYEILERLAQLENLRIDLHRQLEEMLVGPQGEALIIPSITRLLNLLNRIAENKSETVKLLARALDEGLREDTLVRSLCSKHKISLTASDARLN